METQGWVSQSPAYQLPAVIENTLVHMKTLPKKKKSFHSPISFLWVASPLYSLVLIDACHVTMKRQERGRAWHARLPMPNREASGLRGVADPQEALQA